MKHILFDLDGTLLPMDQSVFIRHYFSLLGKRFAKLGVSSDLFNQGLYTAVRAMFTNTGEQTNEDLFWNTFLSFVPGNKELMHSETLDFYKTDFNEAITSTQPDSIVPKMIHAIKEKGFQIYLATNPLFPRIATEQRIRWAGLSPDDFLDITTYEHCHYCKPNIKYFKEFLDKHHLDPKDCLMVGNDVREDLAISELGVETYLITNTIENKQNLPITADHTGTLNDFYLFIKNL